MENMHAANGLPIKAVSYDDIARVTHAHAQPTAKRANFPYAFLRSRLSVLPEENGGSVINRKRMQLNAQLKQIQVTSSMDIDVKCAGGGDNGSASVLIGKMEPFVNRKELALACPRAKRILLVRDSLSHHVGIVFTQQFSSFSEASATHRYLVTDMHVNGLAHLDGRLRIGDEIVNVNGQDLRGMKSCKLVQQLTETFIDNCVDLVIADDEVSTSSQFDFGDRRSVAGAEESKDKIADDIKYFLQQRKQCDLSRDSRFVRSKLSPLLDRTDYVPVYGSRQMMFSATNDEDEMGEKANYKRTKLSYARKGNDISAESKTFAEKFAMFESRNKMERNGADDGNKPLADQPLNAGLSIKPMAINDNKPERKHCQTSHVDSDFSSLLSCQITTNTST